MCCAGGLGSAARFVFVGLFVQMIAAAISVARAAAHNFVQTLSGGEVVLFLNFGWWTSVLHGHVLGLQSLVVRLLTFVNTRMVRVGEPLGVLWLLNCLSRIASVAEATPRVDVDETPHLPLQVFGNKNWNAPPRFSSRVSPVVLLCVSAVPS